MTPVQLRAFDFVRDRLTEGGFSPTIKELAEELSVTESRAGDIVAALVRMGKLNKVRGSSRGLEIAGEPDLRLAGTGALQAELARRGVTMAALKEKPVPIGAGRACAATFCRRRVAPGKLYCREHWFRLPHDLQREILGAFSRRDEQAYGEAFRRAQDLLEGCAS